MPLTTLLVLAVIAFLVGILTRNRNRTIILLFLSTLAIFILQPRLPIRYLDFWFPMITLSIVVVSWAITADQEERTWQKNWLTSTILLGIVLVLGITRYIPFEPLLTASRPPPVLIVIIVILLTGSAMFLWPKLVDKNRKWLVISIGVVLAIFLILKIPFVSIWVSHFLYTINHQYTGNAIKTDLRWLGFSYIAFRIIHTIRDRQSDRLPPVSLAEYVVFIIFFPTLVAGPIDRIERFVNELREARPTTSADLIDGGKRFVLGLFKKFILADTLALVALNATNAWQVRSAGWTWILLYAYAFQILFDFSGYTDIAIGMGRWMGISLPENFQSPYLKPNLTLFWNSWHITLTQWFRAYFFNPLVRAIRTWKKTAPIPFIILFTQMATMIMIGLWHGVTTNFVLWGLWHGMGLFIHNRWSEWTKSRYSILPACWQKALNIGGILLTFHYVTLGWVLFALPDPYSSWHVFLKLFNVV